MSTSNVRNIESLQAFHGGLVGLSDGWDQTLQEVRMLVGRADAYFSQERPAYWRRQTRLAERELGEARDNLAQKRSAARASDRPAATEAATRVRTAEKRLRECEAKQRQAKALAIEISQRCDDLLGPLADVMEHCEVLLPTAASELATLIEQLRAYAEQGKPDS
jgi:predicted transcriptional regulator